jgi:carnitine 3-dehydrogenase
LTDAVAVAGAGLTGASWAGLFAAHGLAVRLYDIRPAALDPAVAQAVAAARFLVDHGLADAATTQRGLAALSAQPDPAAAFDGVMLVQECVAEDLETKRAVFAAADSLAPAEALLATSSSGLSITAIQKAAGVPQRCLAAHPYNPPHLVPLVELAPGEQTSSETMARGLAFYRGVGKEPVLVRGDLPGYVANRLSAALWREAVELVRSGAASVAEVDQAVCDGPGLRWAVMGPHLLYHLGGGAGGIRSHLHHLAGAKEGMLRDLATWTEFPPDTADVLAAGLTEEVGGRSLEQLVAERDEALAAIVQVRSR